MSDFEDDDNLVEFIPDITRSIITVEGRYKVLDLRNITRAQANRLILLILDELTAMFPDWRFQQILWNTKVSDGTDKFHEESVATLRTLLADEHVAEWYKEKKADVLNFNDFKNTKK